MDLDEKVQIILEKVAEICDSQAEAVIVGRYVADTLVYNDIKENIAEDIKNDILDEINRIRSSVDEKTGFT